MARRKKKSKPKKKGSSDSKNKTVSSSRATTWVDDISWERIIDNSKELVTDQQHSSSTQDDVVSVISWNVLAQSYLTKRSHCGLPQRYQSLVFCPKQRLALLQKSLRRLARSIPHGEDGAVWSNTDIMCLQEVDRDVVNKQLNDMGYQGVSTPTTNGGGGGGRVDACCIYFLQSKWTLVRSLVIRLDDLAFLKTKTTTTTGEEDNHDTMSNSMKSSSTDPLKGLQQSFLRRNAAIVVELQKSDSNTSVVVASAHLYWHPDHEHVKLCQVHYVLQKIQHFNDGRNPVVFCGDLNSRPNSIVHEYLTRGHVNAKQVAPWYHWNKTKTDKEIDTEQQCASSLVTGEDVADMLQAQCRLSPSPPTTHTTSNGSNSDQEQQVQNSEIQVFPSIRYMLDFTLNRFTRWLRILGIDTALETTEEEQERTKRGNLIIFDRCREEDRTLLTTSSKLMLRKDCPPGTYLVDPRRLESSLVHLLLSHGVVLEPLKFLTRCVVCNGNICEVFEPNEKKRIFDEHDAPDLSQELSVYCCDGCGQGYWWCDLPGSSAARVKTQATKLFQLCLRGGIPIQGELHMFDYVDVEKERQKGSGERKKQGDENMCLDVIEWLKDECLSHNLSLKSAYSFDRRKGIGDESTIQELLPFTNVTHDFVDTIDYIFLETSHIRQTHRLRVPRTFDELKGTTGVTSGHLLPSNIWPSDHLAIGSCFTLGAPFSSNSIPNLLQTPKLDKNGIIRYTTKENTGEPDNVERTKGAVMAGQLKDNRNGDDNPGMESGRLELSTNEKNSVLPYCGTVNGNDAPPPVASAPTVSHGQRCDCGCVPKILSLFEMAELRKQARSKASKVVVR